MARSDRTPPSDFMLELLRTLEELDVPYMIVGAFGSILFGVNRVTYDIDIIVDLKEHHIRALAAAYPLPRYYADPEQMRDSIRQGIMFTIIDTERGEKADLIPLSSKPENRAALQKRVRLTLEPPDEAPFEIWCARPEDLIVGKLRAWREGRSRKHETDIFDMLLSQWLAGEPAVLDVTYIEQQARALGSEVFDLWQAIQLAAQREVEDEAQS